MTKFFSAVAVVISAIALSACGGAQSQSAAPVANQESAIAAGSIVYFDLDVVLQEYDMANDLRTVVETKVQNIQAEINRRGSQLEKDVNAFQEKYNKGLMTRSVAEAQSAKLQQQEQEFNAYAQQKQSEINEEQVVMMNQLSDAIQTYIEAYNAEKGYSMILINSGGSPVLIADQSLNITEEVLAGLNAEYVKAKSKK